MIRLSFKSEEPVTFKQYHIIENKDEFICELYNNRIKRIENI